MSKATYHGLGRREVLRIGGMAALVTASAAGCGWFSTSPAEQRPGGAKGLEAPDLAAQVEAGKLPPVNERLPENPLVVNPLEGPGSYGGSWQTALLGRGNFAYIYTCAGYENLLRWAPEWSNAAGTEELLPNVAESFEANPDSTEFTFRLRRGMRWSDGEPFTADDVVFAVEDVLLNPDIFPVPPNTITVNGQAGRIEKLDDYAFRIVFPAPAGLFLQRLAVPASQVFTKYPKHYLEQFHAKYNPDVEALVEADGVAASWGELFGIKCGLVFEVGNNPDLPSLWPWRLVRGFADGSRVVCERNPYYWKVDNEGSQLPYLDQVVFDVVDDAEVMLLKASNGELNLELGPDTRFTTSANRPVLSREQDSGDFRFIDVVDSRMNVMCIYLNLNHKSAAMREIFGNKDFRIGLSHALNRQEMVDATMQRQGEPYQAAPLPESAFYDEEFATQYLDYDVELANSYLDRAFPDKNSDGIRLGPDGEPISFTIEYVAAFRPEWSDMLQLVESYWREVGLKVQLRDEERSFFDERRNALEHDVVVWHGDGGLDVLLQPKNYLPESSGSFYAIAWAQWFLSSGEAGEQPPPAQRQQQELYGELLVTGDGQRQADLMRQILQIAKEEFLVIGVARETSKYFIAANSMRNVPDTVIQAFPYSTPGPTNPEQYYIG